MAAVAVRGAKRSLRGELKQRLRAMSAEERLRQSRVLTQKVIAHSEYQKSKRISIFLSMQDEIETEEIIKDIFQRGKICFIPRYQFQSNHMDMVRIESPEEISLLPKTSWNIPQPGEGDVREEALSTGICLSWYSFIFFQGDSISSSCQALGLTNMVTDWGGARATMMPI
ncbi:5-formyltetrahydrofolate cyclo-ligase isoform X4 [Pongo abelii]|uniref:5-formyltetrahydrofolate cyclo-ligase isoform X4 n=1 Tax=Pongo abelii TaxID=9601 RepID=UPI003005B418